MGAHHLRERRVIGAVAVENKPAQPFSQSLKMEKYQGSRIDQHLAVAKTDPVIADIPGREIGADIFDDFHAGGQARKPVEISLVGKTAVIDIVMAPFDA